MRFSHGFDTNSLKLVHNYLSNRKKRVKVNSAYNMWKDIFHGVPQGSMLRHLLFNIHLRDLFYFLENTDIASYADYFLTSSNENNLINLPSSEWGKHD